MGTSSPISGLGAFFQSFVTSPNKDSTGASGLGGLLAVINNPNVPNDKKMEAIAALEKLLQSSPDINNNSIGGEETPEEILAAILAKLKNTLANGGKVSPSDTQQLNAASQAVTASQSTAAA